MTPTEKHRETAREAVKEFGGLMNALPDTSTIDDFREAAVSVFAAALANAEREGMESERKRCIDILEAVGRGAYGSAGTGIAIGAILSQAGEG